MSAPSRKRQNFVRPAGDYGVDAPYLLAVPALLIIAGVVQGILTRQPWSILGAALVLLCSWFGWHANRTGKFLVWSRILDSLQLRGDEQVLDLGCGRGAVLVLAALHLTTGRAVGIDLWRTRDQSGNSGEATKANAAAAGVGDRVDVQTANMTELPFGDASFDLVVCSIAMHNLSRVGQDRALDEAARVLKPGGRLVLADFRATAHYEDRLRKAGMDDIGRRSLGWRMWWSGPWLATRLVRADEASSRSMTSSEPVSH